MGSLDRYRSFGFRLLLSIIAGHQTNNETVTATPAGNVTISKTESTTNTNKNNDLSEILNKNNIALNVQASTRDELLQYLADFSEKLGYTTDSKAVYKKYLAREAENSTGMEKGIAIPHAQDQSIKGSAMLIAKLAHPIAWKTFDNQPVDIVISFLIPNSDDGSNHLEYLSSTSKLLMHDEFVKALQKAQTKEEILQLFQK